ncbi:MAG: 2-succinyl-5-enolpyruvyl-6-hydroxy-3-cyclohexene-1-carboxylate synthase, partial [Gammaproteobacteria bacterium]|nr:2-succinyl-5-enolpyruvyl-6-hydroxy-3-cyclohexene-1-carboxylate synthase [Gammaproteobacteria bacterium]
MDYAELNLRWATALVDGLVSGGVKQVVISPGARSTPLTMACAIHVALRDWVHPDERSAAFFALGLIKGGGAPVAVVATSGSAPANWYPAVIEAGYGGYPLVLVSADRPAELQDCGANQTIDQNHLFGRQVRGFFPFPDANDTG